MKIKTRTLTFRAVKGAPTKYPVRYTVWMKKERGFIPGSLRWDEASRRLSSTVMTAVPLRGQDKDGRLSPWLTVPRTALSQCKKVIAPTNYEPHYAGHAGIYTGGLNGAFFLEVLERYPNGTVLVRNLHDVGKIKCPSMQSTIESDLVFPLIRGRSIARWRALPEGHVLIVQDPKTQRGFPENWLQETHPLTWNYLKNFEELLRSRKAFKKFFNPDKDAFYSMYAIAEYTFSPWKVAWMDISATMKAAVVAGLVGNEMPIPEHTVMFLTTESEAEAHYVAAVLNSHPVDTVVSGYIVDNHMSTHPIENVVIPRSNPTDATHATLARLSHDAHRAAAEANEQAVERAQVAIDETVHSLW